MADTARMTRRSWSGSAFIIEALVLLVLVAGSLAVMFTLFSDAYNIGQESSLQADAGTLAANAAEVFAAHPQVGETIEVEGEYAVYSKVTSEKRPAGTMYYADIAVYDSKAGAAPDDGAPIEGGLDPGEPIYALQTARYVSGVK